MLKARECWSEALDGVAGKRPNSASNCCRVSVMVNWRRAYAASLMVGTGGVLLRMRVTSRHTVSNVCRARQAP